MSHLIVFAKAPVAGWVKTRLAGAVGEQGAARIAAHMLQHTLTQAEQAGFDSVELCAEPAGDPRLAQAANARGLALSAQGEGDLGERMCRAFERALARHSTVLLVGTDCPALSAAHLRKAATRLDERACQAAYYPTVDGGYCLVGLRDANKRLFAGIPWSSAKVMHVTRQRLRGLGWHWWEGETLEDVDEAAQLPLLPASWLEDALRLD